MKMSCHPVAFSVLLLAGCNDSSSNHTNPPAQQSAPAGYLGQMAKAKQHAHQTLDVTAINKAVEEFYVQEGRFPTNLLELAERDYIPFLPVLQEGMNWDYDTNTGVVSISKY